jgi:hypothetical protein
VEVADDVVDDVAVAVEHRYEAAHEAVLVERVSRMGDPHHRMG